MEALPGDAGVFLSGLPEGARRALEERGTVRSWSRGGALFHERQASDRVLVLRRGRVKLVATTEEGRDVLVAIEGPGDVLGELSALDGLPRSATAIALEDVQALALAPADFTAVLGAWPDAALALIRQLARRLRDADRKRVEYASHDNLGRVAARLVELCERFGTQDADGSTRIDLSLSQDELAGWVGSSREAVAKALQTMRRAGWVTTSRRAITVRDLDAVRRRTF